MGRQPIILHPERPPVDGDRTGNVRPLERLPGKWYCIVLRFKHPTLDPEEVSAALGRQPDVSWKPGDPRMTAKGRPLPGVRAEGLWSRTFHFKGEKPIGRSVDKILDELLGSKELFGRLGAMGVKSAFYLQLPGDTNIGDQLPSTVLKKFVDLGIDLELEIFPEWS